MSFIVPGSFSLPAWTAGYSEIIVTDWLSQEVDNTAEERMPVLRDIRGHRNREVLFYVKTHQDWIAKACAELYGGVMP